MGLIGREVGSLPGCDFDWFGWGIGGLVPEGGGGQGVKLKELDSSEVWRLFLLFIFVFARI